MEAPQPRPGPQPPSGAAGWSSNHYQGQAQTPYGSAYPNGGNQFAYGAGGQWGRTAARSSVAVIPSGGRWALAICGIFSLGVTWLIGLLSTAAAVRRLLRSGAPAPLIGRLRGWRTAFLVLTIIAVLFWILVAIGASVPNTNSGSGSASAGASSGNFTIPTTHLMAPEPGTKFQRVRWGTTVTVHDTVGKKLSAVVPFTVSASNLRYPTSVSMGRGANGDAAVNLRVCATTTTVNPGLVLTVFALTGTGGHRFGPLADTPTPFLDNLGAGHCASARVIFRVPSGAKITGASYTPVALNTAGVIWNGG